MIGCLFAVTCGCGLAVTLLVMYRFGRIEQHAVCAATDWGHKWEFIGISTKLRWYRSGCPTRLNRVRFRCAWCGMRYSAKAESLTPSEKTLVREGECWRASKGT